MSCLSDFRWMEMTHFPAHRPSTGCLMWVLWMLVAGEKATGLHSLALRQKTSLFPIIILPRSPPPPDFTTVRNLEVFQSRLLKCSFKLKIHNTRIGFPKVPLWSDISPVDLQLPCHFFLSKYSFPA